MTEPTSKPKLSFEQWYAELKWIALTTPNSWVVSPNAEDHREGYEEGNTPLEELIYQIECAL